MNRRPRLEKKEKKKKFIFLSEASKGIENLAISIIIIGMLYSYLRGSPLSSLGSLYT